MQMVLPFGLLYSFPILVYLSIVAGGAWNWVLPVFAFAVLPVADFIWDRVSPARGERISISATGEKLADLFVHAFVPTQLFLLLLSLIELSDRLNQHGWLSSEIIGLTVTMGIMTGAIGITLAHELVHRREAWSQFGGLLLLSSVFYSHFAVEHVLGHHSHVATRNDPASARRGENVWRFAVRSVVMGLFSAIKIERQRLERVRKTDKLRGSVLFNRLIHGWVLSAVMALIAGVVAGAAGVLFLLAQAVVAVFQLEAINYVEHYGLTRKTLENGKPEPVQVYHSWDSHSRLSSWILINLSRHADHHKYPARPYYQLAGSEKSPLLPANYPACVFLAIIPPLWYRIMHKRLDSFAENGKSA